MKTRSYVDVILSVSISIVISWSEVTRGVKSCVTNVRTRCLYRRKTNTNIHSTKQLWRQKRSAAWAENGQKLTRKYGLKTVVERPNVDNVEWGGERKVVKRGLLDNKELVKWWSRHPDVNQCERRTLKSSTSQEKPLFRSANSDDTNTQVSGRVCVKRRITIVLFLPQTVSSSAIPSRVTTHTYPKMDTSGGNLLRPMYTTWTNAETPRYITQILFQSNLSQCIQNGWCDMHNDTIA